MSWLSEWLKEIIMLILLAAFVDLLLPSAKMQRYVKLMLSLIILLALLSPIMKLFDKNMPEQVAAEWEKSNPTTSAFASLTSIQRDAARLQHQRQLKVNELAASQLESQMMKQLQEMVIAASTSPRDETSKAVGVTTGLTSNEYGVQAASVNVILGLSAGQSEPSIQSIAVSMTYSRQAIAPSPNQQEKLEGIAPVEQVKTVAVQTESVSERSSAKKESPGAVEQYLVKTWEKRIIEILTAKWLVQPEKIQVEWKEK